MLLKHVALECSSEEVADRFYKNLLGLRKMPSKIIPSALSKKIFNLDIEYKVTIYMDDITQFEIFVSNQKRPKDKRVEHVCLEVDDLEAFLNKCNDMGVKILQIPKEGGFLTFISDYDGNLFEIKEK
ncbi:MAG: VOC family protein [Desulfobacterales bacterium]|nr:VOC family protein [Desulfobacterales bacterium]